MANKVRALGWFALGGALTGSAGFVFNHIQTLTYTNAVVIVGLWVAGCMCAPMGTYALTDGSK